jgi:hypothetical protein
MELIKLFLSTIKHQAMQTYGGVEVWLCVFLTSVLDEGERLASRLLPNVAVYWLAIGLLLLTRGVQCSNLIPETGYPDWGFTLAVASPSHKYCGSILNYAMNASFRILSSSLFTNNPVIRRYFIWPTDSVKSKINSHLCRLIPEPTWTLLWGKTLSFSARNRTLAIEFVA